MTTPGFIQIPRYIFDDDFCIKSRRRLTQREALIWLYREAAFKDRVYRISGIDISLKRGQLVGSIRHLAREWKWPRTTVSEYLDYLKDNGLIATGLASYVQQKTELRLKTRTPLRTHITLITICNYDCSENGHQSIRTSKRTDTGQTSDNTEEGNKEIKDDSERGRPRKYGFEGRVIRLTSKDYEQWRGAYSHLEVKAELVARDAYLAGQPLTEQKRWFISTSQYFANRNAKAKAEHAARTSKPERNPWEGII